jgi:hypothetical protein
MDTPDEAMVRPVTIVSTPQWDALDGVTDLSGVGFLTRRHVKSVGRPEMNFPGYKTAPDESG